MAALFCTKPCQCQQQHSELSHALMGKQGSAFCPVQLSGLMTKNPAHQYSPKTAGWVITFQWWHKVYCECQLSSDICKDASVLSVDCLPWNITIDWWEVLIPNKSFLTQEQNQTVCWGKCLVSQFIPHTPWDSLPRRHEVQTLLRRTGRLVSINRKLWAQSSSEVATLGTELLFYSGLRKVVAHLTKTSTDIQ